MIYVVMGYFAYEGVNLIAVFTTRAAAEACAVSDSYGYDYINVIETPLVA